MLGISVCRYMSTPPISQPSPTPSNSSQIDRTSVDSSSLAKHPEVHDSLDVFPVFEIRRLQQEKEHTTLVGQILSLFRKAVYRETKSDYTFHVLTKIERERLLESLINELALIKAETAALEEKYHGRAVGFISRTVDKQMKLLTEIVRRLNSDGDVAIANVELLERYKDVSTIRQALVRTTCEIVRASIQHDMMTLLGSQNEALDTFEDDNERQQFIFSLEGHLLPIIDQFERLIAKEPGVHTLEALFLWKEGVDLKRHLLTNLGLLMIDFELDRIGKKGRKSFFYDEESPHDAIKEQFVYLQEAAERLLHLLTLPSFAGAGDSLVTMLEQVKQEIHTSNDYEKAKTRFQGLLQQIFETICHSNIKHHSSPPKE